VDHSHHLGPKLRMSIENHFLSSVLLQGDYSRQLYVYLQSNADGLSQTISQPIIQS